MEVKGKPTIVNLREHPQDFVEAVPTCIVKSEVNTTFVGGRETKSDRLRRKMKELRNSSMMTALDEELKSDLRWLVNFDLGSVYLHDIDDIWKPSTQAYGSGENQQKKRPSKIPRPVQPTKNGPITYSELLIRCFNENGEISVKGIYNWIMEKFPHFIASGKGWKNAIRHTLSVNPFYQKRKAQLPQRGHLWYLDREAARRSKSHIIRKLSFEKSDIIRHQNIKNEVEVKENLNILSSEEALMPANDNGMTKIGAVNIADYDEDDSCKDFYFARGQDTPAHDEFENTMLISREELDQYYEYEVSDTSNFIQETPFFTDWTLNVS